VSTVIAMEPTMASRRIKLAKINHMECELYITEPMLLIPDIGDRVPSQLFILVK